MMLVVLLLLLFVLMFIEFKEVFTPELLTFDLTEETTESTIGEGVGLPNLRVPSDE